jgi:hypothetical protein
MQKPRRINEIYRFPVTGGICILSLVVTLAAWSGKLDQNLLVENYRVWHGQPWRLLTSTLLHANFIHLAFNLYWTWTFGSIVESAFGSLRSGLLILMLGAGSSAAEYAFGVGGVGALNASVNRRHLDIDLLVNRRQAGAVVARLVPDVQPQDRLRGRMLRETDPHHHFPLINPQRLF